MYLRKKYGFNGTKCSANDFAIMKIIKRILLIMAIVTMTMTAKAQNGNYVSHTVAKGETLYSISKRYNTTVDEIIKFNPGSAGKLSIGQKLIIPRNTAEKKKSTKTHTIKPGETLYRLSKMYDVTTDEICAANPGLSINNFKAGEVIVIPDKLQIQEEAAIYVVATEPEIAKKNEEKELKIVGTHTVKRKEDIESICEEYGITAEELIKANPELKDQKLKRKMVLNIPTAASSSVYVNIEKDAQIQAEAPINHEPQIEEVKISPKGNNGDNVLNVAVVMSFLLDSYAPKEQSRLVEYYQGFLMAVEQLKREGYSFVINTFDAGQKDLSLDSLLASGSLDNAELIIGASYSKHSKELAKFAKEREIPLVIPFGNKKDEALNNPYVYIANGIQQFILPQVSERFIKTFPNANVVFVEDGENNKKEFVKSLTAELNKNNVPHTTLPLSTITNPDSTISVLSNVYQEEKQMIVIPTSSTPATLSALLPSLLETKMIDSTRVGKLKLFGYPEWQIHAKDTREMMYEIDTYIYATFYSHYSLPRVAEFQEEYIRWYNSNIQNIYPRYSMLGYDTGYFFLLAASLHGSMLSERINETPFMPVQTDFKFEKIGSKDGFTNNKFFFIHFCPEYWIEKMDFDLEKYQEGYQDENLNEILNDTIAPVTDESIY